MLYRNKVCEPENSPLKSETQNCTGQRTTKCSSAYAGNSPRLLFTSDQNYVGTDLIRETVLRILHFSIGIKACGAGFEFPGFGGELAPDFSISGSELNDQCGGRISIYLLGHSISSETVVRVPRIT